MPVIKCKGGFDWEGVPVLAYKEDGTHFKSITRRILYKGADELPSEVRYFEIAPEVIQLLSGTNIYML
jgi:hypothetical protein